MKTRIATGITASRERRRAVDVSMQIPEKQETSAFIFIDELMNYDVTIT
jgi:hypothetical protein